MILVFFGLIYAKILLLACKHVFLHHFKTISILHKRTIMSTYTVSDPRKVTTKRIDGSDC